MTWPTDDVETHFKPVKDASNRTKGLRAQMKAAKGLRMGKTAFRRQATDEEKWRDYFRCEVKSGKQVQPMGTAFLIIEEQSRQNKAIGDTRPFMAVIVPDGWGSDGLVITRISTWRREVSPLLDDAR